MSITRFILLGRTRTGSTLLQTLLSSHSQIRVFGELFAAYALPGWGIEPVLKSPKAIALIQNDPVSFLDKYLFTLVPRQLAASPFKPGLRVVGFKLFYDQAREEPWQTVWDYARERTDIRIIHIKRRNLLKAHLSHKRAQASRSWIDTPLNRPNEDAPVSDLHLHLDYEECLRAFTHTREQEQICDEMFASHQRIEVLYEDLSADWRKEIERVQDFLDVPRESLEPVTRKQASLPMANEIANYLELKDRFRGTVWEELFDE